MLMNDPVVIINDPRMILKQGTWVWGDPEAIPKYVNKRSSGYL